MKNSEPLLLEDTHVSALCKPKILALDLDLTLHNVIEHYDETINATLKHFGYHALTLEELKATGDNFTSTKSTLAAYLPADKIDEATQYYCNHFLSREIPTKAIIPGVKELLYLIRKRFKIPIIAITNSEDSLAKKILRDLNALDKIDFVIGMQEGYYIKPDTKMLLTALKAVSVDPGPHVWFMGDRASDTQCAKTANCTAIRFYHKIKPIDQNADLFINSHYHFFNIINTKLK